MTQPLIYCTQPFFRNILEYHNISYTGTEQWRIPGFDHYNYLIDANACFSANPSGDIVDRTQTVRQPWRMWVHRPWQIPLAEPESLDWCFQQRVQELVGTKQRLNLFWSGGIDSTSMLVGFLQHCQNLDQIRVLYSSNSVKENPNFFLLLEQNPNIEMVDFSGDVYLNQNFDGIFVSADGADDMTASLDDSFYRALGWNGINSLWPDFFYKKTNDPKFVEFFEEYTKLSGRPIYTVLEARWWFYTCCKIQKFPSLLAGAIQDHQPMPVAFFDCYEFDHWMFYNTDKIIPNENYSSYKQFLKDYIYDYDQNREYQRNKEKVNSSQLILYRTKKLILQNTQYIMLLQDGTRIRTPHLPFISEREYRQTYGNSLNYLFQ